MNRQAFLEEINSVSGVVFQPERFLIRTGTEDCIGHPLAGKDAYSDLIKNHLEI